MASQIPPKKNTAYSFDLDVFDYNGKYLTGATFTVKTASKDHAAPVTLTNAPSEIGTTGVYTISLTAAEMNADEIHLRFVITNAPDIGADLMTTAILNDEMPAAVRDVDNTTPPAGSLGNKVNSAASAGDPWNTTIPATYGAGTAGYIIGNNLDAAISDVKAQSDKLQFDVSNNVLSSPQTNESGVTTLLTRIVGTLLAGNHTAQSGDNFARLGAPAGASVSADIASIAAKTVNLPSDPTSQTTTDASISGAQAAILVDTGLIKAKTNNLPASPAAVGSQMDLVNAPNATAITAIQSGLATAANLTTVLNRLGAWTGSGRNTVLGALQALFRKDADATVPTDINTNLGSGAGTANNTTDSNEAIRDRGDAAWTTGSVSDSPGVTTLLGRIPGTVQPQTGDSYARLGAPAGASIAADIAAVDGVADIAAVKAQTDLLTFDGSNNILSTPQTDPSGVTTLLTRLSTARAGYLDILAGWTGTLLAALRALARKDVGANTDIAGTHDPSTDSTEALREKVDTLVSGTAVNEDIEVTES